MKILPALLRFVGTYAASLALAVSASASTTSTFTNPATITINDNTIAAPYPATITVSGVNPALVTKVTVSLNGLSHTFPDDVDIILVGPQGQRSIVMSDAGGGGGAVSGITLLFDQNSANILPDNSALASGTFRPANYNGNDGATDTFPAPGPGALTNEPADLRAFNLTNPNGVWKLFVVDDQASDVGQISSGWTLTLTVPAVFTVTNANNGGAGSLRVALAAAQDGDLINFSALFNTPQTINLLTALPDITKSVTIQGPGANLLTVRRDFNAATDFTIFNIPGGVANGVAISGMTITNGRDVGGPGQDGFGGGIDSGSNLTLTNVHVTGNQASQAGGGVSLAFASGVFTGCTFSGNMAGDGGGIDYEGDGGHTLRLVSSTVSGNSATISGGGIDNVSQGGNSRLEVVNSTIANNTGGGIITFTQTGGATTTATTALRNTIIAGNTPNNLATGTIGGGAATFQTLGFNLSDNFNGVFTPAANDITNATPRLAPLSLNGSTTPTHALLAGSPAIDAGNSSGSTTDQRGQPRPFDLPGVPNPSGGDGADIGAVEMRPISNVTTTSDSGVGSLRQAISDANTNADLTDILFDSTVFNTPQTINLLTALPDITTSVTMQGTGANLLTVRRDFNAATDFRIFNIAFGLTNGVAISGMTITGGRATGDFGGGINNHSNLTLTNVHLTGNQADLGGGVAIGFADAVFTGCTFSGNTASGGSGGGIFYQGDGGHTLRLVSSTVSGNSATIRGGGIENVSNGGNSRLEVTNSTIANNTGIGGIITFTQGAGTTATTTLRNTIIAGNTPSNLAIGTSGGGAVTCQTLGFNLASDNGGSFLNVAPITSDKINANAALAPLANYGGTTPTNPLLANSAALDAGNSSGATSDQRGSIRPIDLPGIPNATGGDGADIGAAEMQSFLVTNVNDMGAGSLRDAVTNAPANSDILFDSSVFNVARTITLLTGELVINKNLNIIAPGANLLTLSGNNASRVFNVNGSGSTVSLSGMTITAGNSSGGGGGVFNASSSTLSVTSSAISGNTAASFGGGIETTGRLTVTNSTISGNTSNAAVGTTSGGIDNTAYLTVTNSTISGNQKPNGDNNGGGIWTGSAASAAAIITDSTITNNSAAGASSASGVYQDNGAVTIRNSIIAANVNNATQPDVVAKGGTGITSSGFNLIGNRGSVITFSSTGDQSGTGAAPLNPVLGALQNNGGTTLTHALLLGSPAIDKGQSSGVLTDQRGFLRPIDLPGIANATGGDGADIGAVEIASLPPTPTTVVSRKLHNGVPFDIPLPLTGTSGVECRSGGATNDYQVVFTFPSAITFTNAAVSAGAGSVSSSSGSGTATVTVNLTGVTNAQRITLTLQGASDGTNTGDLSVPMGVLLGDVNGNGSVNSTDISQTKLQSGQPVTNTNFREDVNANGSINATDVSSVKLKSGTALP